jgi:hypothetical protein
LYGARVYICKLLIDKLKKGIWSLYEI